MRVLQSTSAGYALNRFSARIFVASMISVVFGLSVLTTIPAEVGFLATRPKLEPAAETWNPTLGWDFECHSFTHPDFAHLSESQIQWELEQVNSAFELHGCLPPQHHAYPGGLHDAESEVVVSRYRMTGRTNRGSPMMYPVDNWYQMQAEPLERRTKWKNVKEWIDDCIERKGLLHIFSHDVSSKPSQYGCTPEMLTRLLDYLVEQQGARHLTVMTMAEAYDYWNTPLFVDHVATVVISFDDANESDYTIAYPLFKTRGLKGTSYITVSYLGNNGHLNWKEITSMKEGISELNYETADIMKMQYISIRNPLQPSTLSNQKSGRWVQEQIDESRVQNWTHLAIQRECLGSPACQLCFDSHL